MAESDVCKSVGPEGGPAEPAPSLSPAECPAVCLGARQEECRPLSPRAGSFWLVSPKNSFLRAKKPLSARQVKRSNQLVITLWLSTFFGEGSVKSANLTAGPSRWTTEGPIVVSSGQCGKRAGLGILCDAQAPTLLWPFRALAIVLLTKAQF